MVQRSDDARNAEAADDADALAAAMRRVQAGDTEAFARLVDRCERDLRLWVARRAPLAVDCDEVAHRAFIEAYRCRQRYRPPASVRAWLIGIARNCLRQELRRLLRQRERSLEEHATSLAPVDAGGDRWEAGSRALHRCMQELNGVHRQAIAWRHVDGLALAEVAARLQRSAGATATLLNKLRSRLRACVERAVGQEPLA